MFLRDHPLVQEHEGALHSRKEQAEIRLLRGDGLFGVDSASSSTGLMYIRVRPDL
jgi:hypothetical protein